MFWYNFHWDDEDEDNRDDKKWQDDNTIKISVIVRLWYKYLVRQNWKVIAYIKGQDSVWRVDFQELFKCKDADELVEAPSIFFCLVSIKERGVGGYLFHARKILNKIRRKYMCNVSVFVYMNVYVCKKRSREYVGPWIEIEMIIMMIIIIIIILSSSYSFLRFGMYLCVCVSVYFFVKFCMKKKVVWY